MVNIADPKNRDLWVNIGRTTDFNKIIEIEQAQCNKLFIDCDPDLFRYETLELPLEELKNYVLYNN
jgi:hypothetical protein